METIAVIPLLSYVLISTFTPGPSNLSVSTLAVVHGFRPTLRYQAGLVAGVAVMMLAAGLLSARLMAWFPRLEPVLRYGGAAYLLYLAWGLLRATYAFRERPAPPLGFGHGLALQLSNPKLVVYAFTLFTTFLAPLSGRAGWIVFAAGLLALVNLAACVVWGLFGSGLKARLRDSRRARWANAAMAALLAYAAVEMVLRA